MPLIRCVSNTVKTSVSSGVTWNSQSRVLGPGGDQAVSSRPSDQRQSTPDGRTCCDGNVARLVDGGWQNGTAGDWQLLTLEWSSRLDTAEPCLEDTDALSLQVCAGYVQERRACVGRSVADGSRVVRILRTMKKIIAIWGNTECTHKGKILATRMTHLFFVLFCRLCIIRSMNSRGGSGVGLGGLNLPS